jgi:hypothetical protein
VDFPDTLTADPVIIPLKPVNLVESPGTTLVYIDFRTSEGNISFDAVFIVIEYNRLNEQPTLFTVTCYNIAGLYVINFISFCQWSLLSLCIYIIHSFKAKVKKKVVKKVSTYFVLAQVSASNTYRFAWIPMKTRALDDIHSPNLMFWEYATLIIEVMQ